MKTRSFIITSSRPQTDALSKTNHGETKMLTYKRVGVIRKTCFFIVTVNCAKPTLNVWFELWQRPHEVLIRHYIITCEQYVISNISATSFLPLLYCTLEVLGLSKVQCRGDICCETPILSALFMRLELLSSWGEFVWKHCRLLFFLSYAFSFPLSVCRFFCFFLACFTKNKPFWVKDKSQMPSTHSCPHTLLPFLICSTAISSTMLKCWCAQPALKSFETHTPYTRTHTRRHAQTHTHTQTHTHFHRNPDE